MEFIGGAWTPNIIWYLSAGPRRFSELKQDLAGISAKVLTQRLRHLVSIGVVDRSKVDTSPPTVEYRLTRIGEEFKPVIDALIRVGERLKQKKRG